MPDMVSVHSVDFKRVWTTKLFKRLTDTTRTCQICSYVCPRLSHRILSIFSRPLFARRPCNRAPAAVGSTGTSVISVPSTAASSQQAIIDVLVAHLEKDHPPQWRKICAGKVKGGAKP